MRENKTCPDQGWKQLPTEELDLILQAELEKEHPNEEVVLPVLQILEEREKDYPVEKTPEVFDLLKKLNEHETSSKQTKNRRGWGSWVAAIAAVACIVVMAIPRTVGAESIFGVLFRWTGSIFEFFTPEQDATNPPVEYRFETDNPGLQQLYDKVTEMGVTESVVPMWLPGGFELSEMKEIPMVGGTKVYGKFGNGDNTVMITYRVTEEISAKFEKENSNFEVFEAGDVSHFIIDNDENLSVTWNVDGVECLIVADVDKEDVYNVIKSIYRRIL